MLSIKQIKLCLALSFLAVPLFVFTIIFLVQCNLRHRRPGDNFGIFAQMTLFTHHRLTPRKPLMRFILKPLLIQYHGVGIRSQFQWHIQIAVTISKCTGLDLLQFFQTTWLHIVKVFVVQVTVVDNGDGFWSHSDSVTQILPVAAPSDFGKTYRYHVERVGEMACQEGYLASA